MYTQPASFDKHPLPSPAPSLEDSTSHSLRQRTSSSTAALAPVTSTSSTSLPTSSQSTSGPQQVRHQRIASIDRSGAASADQVSISHSSARIASSAMLQDTPALVLKIVVTVVTVYSIVTHIEHFLCSMAVIDIDIDIIAILHHKL